MLALTTQTSTYNKCGSSQNRLNIVNCEEHSFFSANGLIDSLIHIMIVTIPFALRKAGTRKLQKTKLCVCYVCINIKICIIYSPLSFLSCIIQYALHTFIHSFLHLCGSSQCLINESWPRTQTCDASAVHQSHTECAFAAFITNQLMGTKHTIKYIAHIRVKNEQKKIARVCHAFIAAATSRRPRICESTKRNTQTKTNRANAEKNASIANSSIKSNQFKCWPRHNFHITAHSSSSSTPQINIKYNLFLLFLFWLK